MRERVGAWGRRPCAGSAGRGESVGSPAPAEAAENAELGVAVAEREAAPKPRLVFAPPSREEAEEATTELRDAIEM